jgi:O-antigen/teichoic acid export membrane protein
MLAQGEAPAANSTARVVSESIAYTAIDAAQNVLALLVIPASLFWLTPADMGVVTLALVGTQIAMTVVTLGLDFGVIRFFFVWPEEERQSRAIGALYLALAVAVAMTVAASLGAAVWRPVQSVAAVASIAAGAGLGIRAIPLAVFRVTSRITVYAWLVIASSALQAVLQIAVLVMGGGVSAFLVSSAIASWAGAVWGALVLNGRRPTAGRWPDRATFSLASWSLGGALANRAAASLDRLALSVWSTSDALGVYGTAWRWSLPLRMISGGTKLAIAPALSRAGDASEGDAAASLGPFVTLLSLLSVLLLGTSSLMVLTPWRTVVVQFQQLLTLLLAAQLISCLTLIGQVLLYYLGKSAQSTTLAVISAVTGSAALLWLVPRYGTTGAAVAQFLASVVTLCALGFLVGRAQWKSMRTDRPLVVLVVVFIAPWIAGAHGTAAVSAVGAIVLARWAWSDWRGGRRN